MATKREWDRVINHWTRLANGTRREGGDIGSGDCIFCKRYFKTSSSTSYYCEKCPISQETGLPDCDSTPYDCLVGYAAKNPNYLDSDEFKRLAKIELDWLIALRKKVRGD